MSNTSNDIKTNVLNHLQKIFPQLPTPLLLQVILDTISQADQDENIISQYCINKLLELGTSSDESSPIKQLLSPRRSSTQSGDPIHNEYTPVSSTSNMGESSRSSPSPYKDDPSASLLPSTPSMETVLMDEYDTFSVLTPADTLQVSKLPPTSDTDRLRSSSVPSDHVHDRTQDISKLPSLLKHSSTTSKIRTLFSSFGLKNADTICAKSQSNSKTDDSDSDWLFVACEDVTNNQNGRSSTDECTANDFESQIDSSSVESLSIPNKHLNQKTSNPVSFDGTSEAEISTSVAQADSMETLNQVKAVNSISVTSTSDLMDTSEQILRKETSQRHSPFKEVNSTFTPASCISEAEQLEKSAADLSQYIYLQTFPKATESDIPNSKITTIPDNQYEQEDIHSCTGSKSETTSTINERAPTAFKAAVIPSSTATATEDDEFVWVMNSSPEALKSNEKSSKTSKVKHKTQASAAARSPTQEKFDIQISSISKESPNSKGLSATFSVSNYLSHLSDGIDYEHTLKPDAHAPSKTFSQNSSLNTPICIDDDDDDESKDDTEDDMKDVVRQVLEMFPDADVATVRYLLYDVKKSNPENFVSEVVAMFLEEKPRQDKLAVPVNTIPTVSLKAGSSRGDNLIKDDSIPSTSNAPLDKNMPNRKRKVDDMLEDDPSPKKIYSDVVEVKNKNEVDMNCNNPVANCEVCLILSNLNQLGQCCDGHITCSKCIEKQIRAFFTNEDKNINLKCQVNDCSSVLPLSEVYRIMPPLITVIIKDKLEKENLAAIENFDNIIKCPDCGHIGHIGEAQHKEIHCGNTDCKLSFCRFCKKSWKDCNHDNCTSLLSTYNKTGSDNVLESYPKFWSKIEIETDKDFICIEVDVNSEEFNSICTRFKQTVHGQIVSILRIQNTKLWQKYALTRKHILDDFGIQKLNELHLFHGTDPAKIECICQEGFDWRLSGTTNGQAFGRGAYFAVNASYSDKFTRVLPLGTPNVLKTSNLGLFIDGHTKTMDVADGDKKASISNNNKSYKQTQPNYTNSFSQIFGAQHTSMATPYQMTFGLKYMLVARVVCGRSVRGHSQLTRPPPDPSDAKNRLFNSVTDYNKRPSIYCIFESAQSYPEYLIEYRNYPSSQ